MTTLVPTERDLDKNRRNLCDRGYTTITWVHPGLTFDDMDVSMPTMTLEAFLELWNADADALLARYCELMGIEGRPPKLSARRFDPTNNQAPWREELKRISDAISKSILTAEGAAEVRSLHVRIRWAYRRSLANEMPAGGEVPETYLQLPQGFVIGHHDLYNPERFREWSDERRGDTFDTDFRPWLEKVHAA